MLQHYLVIISLLLKSLKAKNLNINGLKAKHVVLTLLFAQTSNLCCAISLMAPKSRAPARS